MFENRSIHSSCQSNLHKYTKKMYIFRIRRDYTSPPRFDDLSWSRKYDAAPEQSTSSAPTMSMPGIRSSAFEREIRNKLTSIEAKLESSIREDEKWKKSITDLLLSMQHPLVRSLIIMYSNMIVYYNALWYLRILRTYIAVSI